MHRQTDSDLTDVTYTHITVQMPSADSYYASIHKQQQQQQQLRGASHQPMRHAQQAPIGPGPIYDTASNASRGSSYANLANQGGYYAPGRMGPASQQRITGYQTGEELFRFVSQSASQFLRQSGSESVSRPSK